MKRTKLCLITFAALLCSLTASAHDFEVNGIYYNITNDTNKTVEVIYKGNDYDSYSNEYTGSVVIPESVTYNGNTYKLFNKGDNVEGAVVIVIDVELGNLIEQTNIVNSITFNRFYQAYNKK